MGASVVRDVDVACIVNYIVLVNTHVTELVSICAFYTRLCAYMRRLSVHFLTVHPLLIHPLCRNDAKLDARKHVAEWVQ